ncbi:MAG: diaminopimelate epimerase [Fimbriimonadaceae bacterium]|nr:MAG: diaminopimelate epimerase [Fimbriimonadaceae bacterium]
MTSLPFFKTQTLGNDFVLVDERDVVGLPLPELAREACCRRFGIGSDGLLVVGRHGRDMRLRMFNPDGSEDFCGNGLRCAAWHGHLEGWFEGRTTIWHGGRPIPAEVKDGLATIELPPADFSPEAVPVVSAFPFIDQAVHGVVGTAVSTGSAHFVAIVDELPQDPDFARLSSLIENDPVFPERVSVMYARPTGDRSLELRIWERAVGETLGCGTGMVAAAVVWARRSGFSGRFSVASRGGELLVDLDSWESPVRSSSAPVRVFDGTALVHNARRLPDLAAS